MVKKFFPVVLFIFIFAYSSHAVIPNTDVNQDGIVNWVDLCAVVGAAIFDPVLPVANADINKDGKIDTDDLILIRDTPGFNLEKELLGHEPEITFFLMTKTFKGDINRDGLVNILDLVAICKGYGQNVAKSDPRDIDSNEVLGRSDLDATIPLFGVRYFIFDPTLVGKHPNFMIIADIQKMMAPFGLRLAVKPNSKITTTWAKIKH